MNTVHDTTNAAKDKAADLGSQAAAQAKSQVDSRTTQAGDLVQNKAEGLHQMSDQLRDKGQDAFAGVADRVASYTEDLAKYLRDADADKLLNDVERAARQQPWAVAAGGLLLGFAASRFVKASTDSRSTSSSSTGAGTDSATPSSIDLTQGYAAGTTTGYESDYDTDYTSAGAAGGLPTGYEPLGTDLPAVDPLTADAPLGDPDTYPSTPSGSYTDGNR
ncbi:hypothetical protein [Aquipuribacter hungaricus]|uniref:DUF883 domain-containing protein n=1 Tax=Aquipuribacter hungaricus TaxID=545624 RepID=A0ABV7WBT3_9MICO